PFATACIATKPRRGRGDGQDILWTPRRVHVAGALGRTHNAALYLPAFSLRIAFEDLNPHRPRRMVDAFAAQTQNLSSGQRPTLRDVEAFDKAFTKGSWLFCHQHMNVGNNPGLGLAHRDRAGRDFVVLFFVEMLAL